MHLLNSYRRREWKERDELFEEKKTIIKGIMKFKKKKNEKTGLETDIPETTR